MENIIACNLGSYRGHFSQEEMYTLLAKIGLTNVEIPPLNRNKFK